MRSGVCLLAGAFLCLSLVARSAGAQPLPAGWTATNVGTPALTGAAALQGERLSVTAAGTDVWGTSDQFMFVHSQMTGDGFVVARVDSLKYTSGWAKAGIMIRESLSAKAAHAFAVVSAEHGTAFVWRQQRGQPSHLASHAGAAPVWVKLQRSGSTVTMSVSADGAAWSTVASTSLELPATSLVGFAVTSHRPAALTTAVFSGMTVSGTAPIPGQAGTLSYTTVLGSAAANGAPTITLTAPAADASFASASNIELAASASDPDGPMDRVEFYANSTLIGIDRTAPYTMTWTKVTPGTYSVKAVAHDFAGGMGVSGERSIVVAAQQLLRRAVFAPSADHETTVEKYVVELFPAGADPSADVPAATQDVGKPQVVNGECEADVSGTFAALPPGVYFATIAAVGSAGASRSAPSAQFIR